MHKGLKLISDALHNVFFNLFMLELQKEYIQINKLCIPQKDHKLNLEMYFESFKNQNFTEKFLLPKSDVILRSCPAN